MYVHRKQKDKKKDLEKPRRVICLQGKELEKASPAGLSN